MDSTLILDRLEGFTVKSKSNGSGGKSSKYENLFRAAMGTAGYHDCEGILDPSRTVAHNKINISSCAGKFLARKELKGSFEFVHASKDGLEYLFAKFNAPKQTKVEVVTETTE
jgi:hypothetical protein